MKVVLITGGSSGIGKSIGDFLTQHNFIVYGTTRDPSKYLDSKFNLIKSDINKRNDIIASNIANAATPNYKARDINFLDEFKKVTNTGEIKTTHSNHIPTKNYNISG